MDAARIAQIRAEAFEEAATVAEKPFLPFSTGGDLIMDRAQGETTATAIRKLAAAERSKIIEPVGGDDDSRTYPTDPLTSYPFEALDPDERAGIEAEHAEFAAVIRQRELDPMRVSSPWLKPGKPRKRGK
jgi:hypothetical protein